MKEIHNLTDKENTKLLVTLAPFQDYFITKRLDNELYLDYLQIKENLCLYGVEYIDVNEVITWQQRLYSEDYLNTNNNCDFSKQGNRVLGADTDSLLTSIFLDDDPFRSPHLNTQGNELFAQTVYDKIDEILSD